MKTLILGGVRSGKSRLAEALANDSGAKVIYVATATADDREMRARIEIHKQDRPDHWQLIEEPIALGDVLQDGIVKEHFILVDCLTLWLTNLIMTSDTSVFEKESEHFLQVLPKVKNNIVLVSNETGMGVVPLGELSRRYCDEAGRLHQRVAEICDRVIVTMAGLPMILKGEAL